MKLSLPMAQTEWFDRPSVALASVFGSLFFFWVCSSAAIAQTGASACGDLAIGRGTNEQPLDYRTNRARAEGSEAFHFTPEVEALIRGKSAEYIAADIDFILRHFPNHPRALVAMMRYAEKIKSPQPPKASYTVECYFERALRFQSDDNIVRMIYASFLSKNGRDADALRQLEIVSATAGDNSFTHYNAGLIYLEMKQYDRALARAHRAIELGFPRSELKDRLKSAGQWSEPLEVVSVPAAPASDIPQTQK